MASNKFEQIVDDFELLEDWEERYRYVIEMGKELVKLREQDKNSNTKVNGCASQVWLLQDVKSKNGKMFFYLSGDSDALIVKGLVAILIKLYNGVEVRAAEQIDALSQFKKLGLDEHLSSQRSNGLRAMVDLIRVNLQMAIEKKMH